MEQLMKKFLARRNRESIERVTGSVGKGAAKSQNLLELRAGVQPELIGSGCSQCRTPSGSGSGGKTFVARRDPNGNLRAAIRHLVAGTGHCRCRWPNRVRNNRCR